MAVMYASRLTIRDDPGLTFLAYSDINRRRVNRTIGPQSFRATATTAQPHAILPITHCISPRLLCV